MGLNSIFDAIIRFLEQIFDLILSFIGGLGGRRDNGNGNGEE